MHRTLAQAVAGVALALAFSPAPAEEHAAKKHAFNLPPSADLVYSIKVRQKGLSLGGEAQVSWRAGDGKYSMQSDSRASILGKLLETRSAGAIDSHGLAPVDFYEKRYRKDPYTVTFDRAGRIIRFSEASLTYPIKGGEQDRGSAPWQLAALARAAPDKFVAGAELRFFVAGRRDGAPWVFKVVGRALMRTALGEFETVHLVRTPAADSGDQKLDIWLAPAHEWYPARIRLSDQDDDTVDQVLEKIVKK